MLNPQKTLERETLLRRHREIKLELAQIERNLREGEARLPKERCRPLLGEVQHFTFEPNLSVSSDAVLIAQVIGAVTGHEDIHGSVQNALSLVIDRIARMRRREVIKDLELDLDYGTSEQAERAGLVFSKKWVDAKL